MALLYKVMNQLVSVLTRISSNFSFYFKISKLRFDIHVQYFMLQTSVLLPYIAFSDRSKTHKKADLYLDVHVQKNRCLLCHSVAALIYIETSWKFKINKEQNATSVANADSKLEVNSSTN